MTVFFPQYVECMATRGGRTKPGWYIMAVMETGRAAAWTTSDLNDCRPCFARKQDCEIAIKSLTEAGITTIEAIDSLDEEKVVQICCRDLLW